MSKKNTNTELKMPSRKYLILYIVGITLSSLLPKVVDAQIENIVGLVCYYRGDSLNDSSGFGKHLSAINGAVNYEVVQSTPFSSTSRNVFKFNGSGYSNDYLKSPVSNLPLGDSPRTIMGWIRVDATSVSGWAAPFAYGGSGTRNSLNFSVVAGTPTGTNIDVYGHCEETNNGLIESDIGPFGVWKHYAITYENISGGRNLLAYVNGILTYTGTLPNGPLSTTNTDFFIGARSGGADRLYAAVAEVAVINRALTETEIKAVVSGTAGGGGDPHFYGFGGIFFTWQGHCDLILLKSPKCNNDETELDIHIRTQRIRKWSTINAIAIKSGESVIEIESTEGVLVLNGNKAESFKTNSLSVTRSIAKSSARLKKKIVVYDFVIDSDKMFSVEVNTRTQMVYVNLKGDYPQGTTGILGSPQDPGQFLRDGTNVTGQDVNEFVEDWQIRDTDPQLFHKNRNPHYPHKCLYNMADVTSKSRRLKEIHTVSKEEAMSVCSLHRSGPLRVYCMEDVVSTGDIDSANDAFYG